MMRANIGHDLRTRYNLDIELLLELMERLHSKKYGVSYEDRTRKDPKGDRTSYRLIGVQLHDGQLLLSRPTSYFGRQTANESGIG